MAQTSIYPKVFSLGRHTLHVKFDCNVINPTIRIQAMELYGIAHTANMRIDEDTRYAYQPLTKVDERHYTVQFEFHSEQKYFVHVLDNGKEMLWTYVYAVAEDLAKLRVFKGDTHLHSCRSDGTGTPFQVACNYRKAGFDFIALTDHHKMYPSEEAQQQVQELTDKFCVFRGEEVHNHSMGLMHVINFGGNYSVNEIIDNQTDFFEKSISQIIANYNLPNNQDKKMLAMRIFTSEQIRKSGGLAIMAHPFWEAYGEYFLEAETIKYLLANGYYDAVEMYGDCDYDMSGNGNNLISAMWTELVGSGVHIPVVGASDSHNFVGRTLFDKCFTLTFAENFAEIPHAIQNFRSVAVHKRSNKDFWVQGSYRYVKYARFLLAEYYSQYVKLTAKHAKAMESGVLQRIADAENKIDNFNKTFFAFC